MGSSYHDGFAAGFKAAQEGYSPEHEPERTDHALVRVRLLCRRCNRVTTGLESTTEAAHAEALKQLASFPCIDGFAQEGRSVTDFLCSGPSSCAVEGCCTS